MKYICAIIFTSLSSLIIAQNSPTSVFQVIFGNGGFGGINNLVSPTPSTTTTTTQQVPIGVNSASTLCQLMGWFASCSGPEYEFGALKQKDKDAINNNCKGDECAHQKQVDITCKTTLMRLSTKLLVQAANGGKPVDEIDPKVKEQFEAIMEYKKTLFQKSKLGNNIVPVDNGLVDGDVILTTQQARILIDNLKKKTGNKAEGSFRRKRSSLFFELNKNFAQKWDISNPIPYTIAEDFNAKEIESVGKGIKMITDVARCIKFKHFELSKDASKNPYHFMYFAKNENTTACGISDIGRVSDRPNALWLNFEGTGCLPKDMSGVIAHEIMHALGISHMHQRVDREKYLGINWDKIDPQAYSDFIAVDPSIFSTYGVPFAYDSIMLYKWNQGGRGFSTKTMEPLKGYAKNLHIMGQRTELSKSDKEILNKAYCYSQNCRDYYVNCGAWALDDMCKGLRTQDFMKSRCRKSCGYCGGTQNY